MFTDIFTTEKKYNVVYADPPWKFSSKQLQNYDGKRFKPLEEEYNTERTLDLKEWPIKKIADKDCAIFMWTTDAHIPDAIDLMKAWGFKYTTIAFIWAKKTNKGNQVSTLGAWTMKNCEICLLGTKGHMLKYKKANNIQQLFAAERREHSRKPDEMYEFIESIFGKDISKIELFARQEVSGWDCYGNEVDKFQMEIN